MKNTNFWKSSLMILLFCFGLTSLWGQNIFISQYIETNSGSTPKGVEIFNAGSTDIVFSGSNNLQIYQGTNGASCSNVVSIDSGTLKSGEVWVIGTSDLVTFANDNGTNLSGTTTFAFSFNGDDALQLRLGGTLFDVFGTCGNDPGSAWTGGGVSTANNNIQTLESITSGTTSNWTNPSLRFETVGDGSTMTGFGDAPYALTQSYTLTYTAGANGSIDGISPQTINEGEDGTAVTAVPNEGYHFVNWSDDSTDNPRTDTNVTADISVTANFAINTYTVTYNGNGNDGGTAPIDENTHNHGSDVTVLGHGDLTLTDHSFLSWNTQADGLGTAYLTGSTISNITSDITLYAQWLDDSLDPQTITFDPLADSTYGDTAFELTATSDSGLPVSYASSNENVATIDGNTVTIVGVGTTDITASQTGDEDYQPAVPVVQTLTVNPKNLTISGATVADKTYDGTTTATIDVSGASLTGVVGDDDVDFAAGTGEFVSADAGTDIAVTLTSDFTLTGTAAGNYTLTQPALTGNILKAEQTVTLSDLNVYLGDEAITLPTVTDQGIAIEYISDNESVATVEGNVLNIVGLGTTEVFAGNNGSDNYEEFTGGFEITVTEAPEEYAGVGVFEKITSLDDLTDGYYVIARGTTAMSNNFNSSPYMEGITVTISDNQIINPIAANVWKIETNGEGLTIFNEVTEKYISVPSNTNTVAVINTVSNKERFTVAMQSGYFRFSNVEYTNRTLQKNNSLPRFLCYAATQSDLELYKLVPPSTDPLLTVSETEITGLNYGEGNGPSAAQSFELSGENLDGSQNLTLVADTGFEISTTETGTYSDEITLTAYNGASQTIWVRMAAGLAVNTYNGTIYIDGYGLEEEVTVSGAVLALPVVTGDIFEGTVGVAFSEQIVATETPTAYAITSGALPDGLSLDTETGIISGTPTTAGDLFEIEVTATNAAGTSEPASFLFDIAKGTQTATLPNLNAYEGDADITLPELTDQGFAIEYISDNEDVATLDGNILTIVGIGTADIFAGNEETVNYEAFTGGFTLTVTEAPITPEAGMLFITEIADASNFNNDYIEIYNNTGNAIDMTGAKLVMIETGSSTVWNIGGTGAGNNIGTATIPARGFLIISRGNDLTTFESAFGTLNENTVFIQGTTGMYFGNGRNWELYFGGTVAVADGILIDGTTVAASGGGIRTYQNIFTGDFINIPLTSADANPGALDYLVYTAGDWTNSMAADATTSTEDVYVFGDLEVSAGIQAANFGLAANGSVNIAAGGSLTLSGTLTNNAAAADFVVSNNANLIQTSDVANEGAITVIRNSEPMKRLDYAMWSAPVSGQNLFGFSPLTVNGVTNYVGFEGRIYVYNGTEGYIHPDPYTAESVMNTGVGYLFRAPNNFHASDMVAYEGVFTGVPNNGTIAVPLTTIPGTNDPYTSMGNPYPSNIDFADFMTENIHVNSINFWRNADSGAYIACTTGGCTNSVDLTDLDYISVGQGFIVEHKLEMPADDVVFTNDMRVSDSADFYNKTDEAESHRFWLNLTNDAGQSYNQILTAYMSGATHGIDHQIDAKLFGYEGSALYNIVEEDAYVIQGRALPFETSDVVPLGFRAAEGGKFKVSLANFDGLFAEGAVNIYLKDNQLDIIHNLMESDYEFESAQGEFKDRFEVVYETEGTMGTGDFDSNLVQIYQHNNRILISSKTEQILSVELFDLQGRNIHRNAKVNAHVYQIESASFGTQVLVVKVQTQNGEVVTKKVINK